MVVQCFGIGLNDLERLVITWVQVLGIYLYSLGGVYYTGNQGLRARYQPPFQSSIVPKGIRLLSTQPTQVRNDENLLNRQTGRDTQCRTPA